MPIHFGDWYPQAKHSNSLTDSAQEKIADEGFDPEYGARPLTRSIQKNVEDNLSELILSGQDLVGDNCISEIHFTSFRIC